jgi:hypothetical protein
MFESNTSIRVRVSARKTNSRPQARLIDLDSARRYLAGVESMAREASTSQDPRVITTALRVLSLQGPTVEQFAEVR